MNKLLQTLAISALCVSVAHAHATLKTSVPENGTKLSTAPQQVTLTFSEPVKLTMLALRKDGGSKQDLGPLPTKADATFTVSAPSMTNGRYVIAWRALADDAHVMSGQIAFGVGVEAQATGAATHHEDHAGHDEHADQP
jgi:methionine-rich copper-binding protein CopC